MPSQFALPSGPLRLPTGGAPALPAGRVLMTEPSYFLIERVLHNSVNVMKRQRTERNIPDYPLFHHNEVDEFSYLFQGFKYGKPEPWSPVRRARPTSRRLR